MHVIRHNGRVARGGILIYVLVAMVALTGLASLGVDLAHARLVKSQLQTAADAAARNAATGLSAGVSTAQNNAVNAAAANTADGTSVVVDPNNDVQFGTWSNGTFTILSGAARSTANAVRVSAQRSAANGNAISLAFGQLIGKSTCDVTSISIALAIPGAPAGIVGISTVTMTGNPLIDSFDSRSGPYSAATATAKGNVASNGSISLQNSTTVQGNVIPGPGQSVTISGAATVSGSTTAAASAYNYSAVSLPSSYTNIAAINLSGIATQTLTSGSYHLSSISMSNSAVLTVVGQVTLYVDGNVSIIGNSVVNDGYIPSNLRIRLLGSGTVVVTNGVQLYADIYAPQSAITCNGAGGIYGAAVGQTLNVSNGGGIHYDTSLTYTDTSIATVQ